MEMKIIDTGDAFNIQPISGSKPPPPAPEISKDIFKKAIKKLSKRDIPRPPPLSNQKMKRAMSEAKRKSRIPMAPDMSEESLKRVQTIIEYKKKHNRVSVI